jgi:hypothetical protein
MTATAQPSPIGANFTTLDRDDPTDRPPLPSAEDHYANACRLLGEAHGAGYNLGERRALIEAVEQHIRAGELALRIWPAPAVSDHLLDENRSMAEELVRLLPVAQAARKYLSTDTGACEAGVAYDELAAAVAKLDAA